MIKPVNGHLLVQPLKHESFIASQKGNFDEIGVVIALSIPEKSLNNDVMDLGVPFGTVKIGDKVYFDSWLIARYPDGKEGELWLVKWQDVRAVETNEEQS